MSKKSRERRMKQKGSVQRADDYFDNGLLEAARFGKNTILKNHMSPEHHSQYMQHLEIDYPSIYKRISQKVDKIREEIAQCDPLRIMLYTRDMVLASHMNVFSEHDYTHEADAIIRAQEYIQSVLVSTKNTFDASIKMEDQENVWNHVIVDFEDIYDEFICFYNYWATYATKNELIEHDMVDSIVEAQMMYWVRGNRYQVFQLEPLKRLLPPHNDVLIELFGVQASDIIDGLERLEYSLTQGYADAWMDLFKEYDNFSLAIEAGADENTYLQETQETIQPIFEKAMGASLNSVSSITGWDCRFIDALSFEIGENTSFFDGKEFSGWPIIELPIKKKPFIKINGISYAFCYYPLFDDIYRAIQKAIFSQKREYIESWKEKQTKASEEMVKEIFLKLLPGAIAHINNYYPVKDSLKQKNENDIIIVYENYLFIIEVKAGSFPQTPPMIDFHNHIRAYTDLAQVADSQCSRTIKYISEHTSAQFYTRENNKKFELDDISKYKEVYTFSVTLDNFNEFAAKAEKLSFITLTSKTIVISYDDLLSYAQYFESPIYFLHYLKQRKAALDEPLIATSDELDHLGLYIDQNLYSITASKLAGVNRVLWDGFRTDLDEYFIKLYVKPEEAIKPRQNIPKEICDIITYLENDDSPSRIQLSHFLLDMSSEGRDEFCSQVNYALTRQRQLGRMFPVVAFGEIKYCIFITCPNINVIDYYQQREYVYSAISRNESIPLMWITLEYDNHNVLHKAAGQLCNFPDLQLNEMDHIRELGEKNAKNWLETYRRKNGHINRNDYCPCGSGKKYKFCCIKYDT